MPDFDVAAFERALAEQGLPPVKPEFDQQSFQAEMAKQGLATAAPEPAPFSAEDLAKYGVRAEASPFARPQKQFEGSYAEALGLTPQKNQGESFVYDQQGNRIQDSPAPAAGTPPTPAPPPVTPQAPAPSYAQPQYHAATWNPNAFPLPASQRKHDLRNVQNERYATQELIDATAARNQVIAEHQEDALDVAKRQQAVSEQREVERRDYARQKFQEADKFATEAASGKIDPGHYMADQSTGVKMAMVIGGVLGGWVNAKTGAPNAMLSEMQTAIRDDIDAQKANIGIKQKGAEQKMNAYHALIAAGNDELQADLQLEMAQWRIAKQQLETDVANTEDPIAKARGDLALNEMAKKEADLSRQYWLNTYQKAYTTGGNVAANKDGDKLFVPTGPKGEGFFARTEDEAKKARGLAQAKATIVPKLQRLIKLREDSNFAERGIKGVWQTEKLAEMKSLEAQVALGLRELSTTSPGAMDKGMQELAGDIQGDWTSVQGHPEVAARSFIGSIDNQWDSLARSQGGQAAQQSIGITPKGQFQATTEGQPGFYAPRPSIPGSFKPIGE